VPGATIAPGPSAEGQTVYRPRRPAATVLHRTVREHLETYLAGSDAGEDVGGCVPFHVQAAFHEYLRCGILAHGFARAYCASCGHDFLIAFSCKGRDICPSCATRRMVETAAHLVDQVLPRVAYRQWVLSVPKRVRWHLREKPEALSGVLGVFLRAVETTLRQRSPGASRDARFGAVAFVHRFGSYLNSHVHFHVLVTDGVFSDDGEGGAELHRATELDTSDIAAVQAKIRRRGLRWLHRHGHLDDLAIHTLDSPDHAGGWSVDASVTIPDWDRQGLERLVRYCARPPLAQERLSRIDDEHLVYRLRKPTLDGRTELILTPLELLDRLAHLVTPPRRHKHRYCGVVAPNAKLRGAVIASAGPAGAVLQVLEEAREKMGLAGADDADTDARPLSTDDAEPRSAAGRLAARGWALLLARIFECLPLVCPRCGEPMRIIAFILDRSVIERILEHVGEPTEAPAVLPARSPPQGELGFAQVDASSGVDAWPEIDQTGGGADGWE